MNIYQRINEIRKKVTYIQKVTAVQTYKAVTHDQVTAALRASMVEQNILILPHLISTKSLDAGATSKGTVQVRVEAEYSFSFINGDEPADGFQVSVSAHAIDTGDKAAGKALSYAMKMVLLKVFTIETGESDESRFAEDFDLLSYAESLSEVTSKDVVQHLYLQAKAQAIKLNDTEAFKKITDITKGVLAKIEGGAK